MDETGLFFSRAVHAHKQIIIRSSETNGWYPPTSQNAPNAEPESKGSETTMRATPLQLFRCGTAARSDINPRRICQHLSHRMSHRELIRVWCDRKRGGRRQMTDKWTCLKEVSKSTKLVLTSSYFSKNLLEPVCNRTHLSFDIRCRCNCPLQFPLPISSSMTLLEKVAVNIDQVVICVQCITILLQIGNLMGSGRYLGEVKLTTHETGKKSILHAFSKQGNM